MYAGRPRASCSIRPVNRPRSSLPSRATRWRSWDAGPPHSRPQRSAPSSPARSPPSALPFWPRPSRSGRCWHPPTTSLSWLSRSSRSAPCSDPRSRADYLARHGPVPRSRRHRDHLGPAVDLRAPPRRRNRHRARGCGALRRRRAPVRGQPDATRSGRAHPGHPWMAQLDDQGRLASLLETVAARHRDRVPHRHDPGRWSGCRHLPLLRARRSSASARTSSAAAPSKVSQVPKLRTMRQPPEFSCHF